MTVSTYMQLVELIENSLGWVWPDGPQSMYRKRAAAAGRIKAQVAKLPDAKRPTLRDLEITVEYLRRKGQAVREPTFILRFVDDAKAASAEVVDDDRPLDDQIRAALRHEEEHRRADWEDWSTRLWRSAGPFRANVLREWREAGRDK